MSPYVGISGGTSLITKRFIFTLKVEKYGSMDQINSGEKPYKTIEYTGLYGKIYKTDFIVRTFCNKDGFGYSKKSLNVYNDNNEYEKTTYKNNLIVETKKGTKNGFTIVKKRYNKDKLLIGVRIDDGIESKSNMIHIND